MCTDPPREAKGRRRRVLFGPHAPTTTARSGGGAGAIGAARASSTIVQMGTSGLGRIRRHRGCRRRVTGSPGGRRRGFGAAPAEGRGSLDNLAKREKERG